MLKTNIPELFTFLNPPFKNQSLKTEMWWNVEVHYSAAFKEIRPHKILRLEGNYITKHDQ